MLIKSKYILGLCFVIAAIVLVSCSQTENHQANSHSEKGYKQYEELITSDVHEKSLNPSDLDEWVGDYEYLYPTATQEFKDFAEKYPNYLEPDFPYFMKPKFIMHNLSVYKEGEKYFGLYAASGWLTSYEIIVKIKGDDEEIFIIYDSVISGGLSSPAVSGDVLFTLKKSNGALITQWGFIFDEEEAFVKKE